LCEFGKELGDGAKVVSGLTKQFLILRAIKLMARILRVSKQIVSMVENGRKEYTASSPVKHKIKTNLKALKLKEKEHTRRAQSDHV
jgi:hypothetical protein